MRCLIKKIFIILLTLSICIGSVNNSFADNGTACSQIVKIIEDVINNEYDSSNYKNLKGV